MSDPLHESLLVRQQYMGLLGFWGWQDCQAAPGTWVSGSSVQRNRCNNFLLRQFFKILTMPSVFSWKGTPKWVVKWPNLEVAVQRYKFRKIFRSAKLEKTFLNFFVPASPFYFFSAWRPTNTVQVRSVLTGEWGRRKVGPPPGTNGAYNRHFSDTSCFSTCCLFYQPSRSFYISTLYRYTVPRFKNFLASPCFG